MPALTQLDKNRFGPWAIVTGASSGIGAEFARQLAVSRLNLVLVARRLPLLEELGCALAQKYGIEYRALGLDLSDETCLEQLESATDDLDVGLVVSNAGTGNPGEFLRIERGVLRQTVQLNVLAHLNITHHFGARLAVRRRGGIILVSAMGAAQGIPFMANDSATKAYILTLGETLNVEFKKHGVNVSVLQPGQRRPLYLTSSDLMRRVCHFAPCRLNNVFLKGLSHSMRIARPLQTVCLLPATLLYLNRVAGWASPMAAKAMRRLSPQVRKTMGLLSL